jgi:hypothetical protein
LTINITKSEQVFTIERTEIMGAVATVSQLSGALSGTFTSMRMFSVSVIVGCLSRVVCLVHLHVKLHVILGSVIVGRLSWDVFMCLHF